MNSLNPTFIHGHYEMQERERERKNERNGEKYSSRTKNVAAEQQNSHSKYVMRGE